jgi:RNA polymerase primary sigma factor
MIFTAPNTVSEAISMTNSCATAIMSEDPKSSSKGFRHANSDYFFQDEFEDASIRLTFLGPMPGNTQAVVSKAPAGVPSYWARLWTLPVLTAEQEFHCFRRLNYLKYLMSRVQRDLYSCLGCVAMLDEYESHKQMIVANRSFLIESNLRLVVSLAKRHAGTAGEEFDDMVCVGNASLVRAVDLFDYRRGIRFSTYAYQAIQCAIFDSFRREKRLRGTFVADGNSFTESAIRDAAESDQAELHAKDACEQVSRLMGELDDRERQIVLSRFGINHSSDGLSFSSIAKEIGVSTTRTVQLFHRSIAKMRRAAMKRHSSRRLGSDA